MKKIITIIAAILVFASAAIAQPRAIGIRGGYGVEASYQHTVGSNFIEADLGFGFGIGSKCNYSMATAIYDFALYKVDNFNFYAGPGLQLALYPSENVPVGFSMGIVGQVGVEYQFKAPINLSLDWRPTYQFLADSKALGFRGESIMLGFRYRF